MERFPEPDRNADIAAIRHMGKRILYIVIGTLLVFGILFLLWSWWSQPNHPSQTTGTFGTASNSTTTSSSSGPPGNGTISLGQTVGAGSYNAQGVYVGQGNGTYDAQGNYVGYVSTQSSTETSNSTGTVGAGSYNAQGVYVGQGNGTYDAQGNYVGYVSTQSSTETSNSTGTVGAGSYNAQGVYVGQGNGTYDAQGNYVGYVGTVGSTTVTSVPGAIWLGGTSFNPTGINSVSSGANGFVPTITTTISNNGSGAVTLIEALAGTAIAGTLTCAAPSLVAAIAAGGTAVSLPTVVGAATGVTITTTGAGPEFLTSGIASFAGAIPVNDYITHNQLAGLGLIQGASFALQAKNSAQDIAFTGNKVVDCFLNVIAKVALQQITVSVVNWINSGFSGQPAFVNDYQQFFTNVADAAAGAFIQGSPLSFLCSPFQLQIKIAIAQAYATRAAQSCTLTKLISDINGFMNGAFSSGGWPGFISFTTVPTNNPYGAFAYAQVGLATAQSQALTNAKNNISPTGFLNLQKLSGCSDPTQNGISGSASIGVNPQAAIAAGKAALPPGCTATVVTPGSAIAASLTSLNNAQINQLGIGNDIDQIITALTTQLMTHIVQNGLSSLSQTTTQTPADIAAESQATTLLGEMQTETTLAQQLGSIYQGSIGDIESAQEDLNSLASCWGSVASSSPSAAQASQNASNASEILQSLNTQIDILNNNITEVNNEIAELNQFQEDVSSAQSDAGVANATASYNAAAGSFPAQTDVTTAQQNRTTEQAQLATLEQSVQTSLTQCQAGGNESFNPPWQVSILVTGVTLTDIGGQAGNLAAGNTDQLSATVAPSDATDATVTWYSDTPSVATVDANGLVTAVAPGTANITAASTDGSNITSNPIIVTVPTSAGGGQSVQSSIPVASITITDTGGKAGSLPIGSTDQLSATVAPSDATNQTVTWSSDNTVVAAVYSNGLVTGLSPGTANITAVSTDGSDITSNAMTVTVSNPQQEDAATQ